VLSDVEYIKDSQSVSHYIPCFLGIPGHLLSVVILSFVFM
jgi:hypothetical protein